MESRKNRYILEMDRDGCYALLFAIERDLVRCKNAVSYLKEVDGYEDLLSSAITISDRLQEMKKSLNEQAQKFAAKGVY